MAKKSKIDLFIELAKVDNKGVSHYVHTEDFKGKYSELKLGNGGGWCRLDQNLGKRYKVVTIKYNGTCLFSWENDIEEINIRKEIKKLIEKKEITIEEKGIAIKYIKLCGYQNAKHSRPISKRIRDHFRGKPCVVCASKHNTVIDHKNGLYNDDRVLNINTQEIGDFQVLCNHCNLQKRQTIKIMKETGKRYSALNIPSVSMFNIPFTEGDENYDKKNSNWGKGTYWDDPCDFIQKCIILKRKRKAYIFLIIISLYFLFLFNVSINHIYSITSFP